MRVLECLCAAHLSLSYLVFFFSEILKQDRFRSYSGTCQLLGVGMFTVVHLDAIRKKQKLYPPGFTNCHVQQMRKLQHLENSKFCLQDLENSRSCQQDLENSRSCRQDLESSNSCRQARFGKFQILQLTLVNSPPLTHHY